MAASSCHVRLDLTHLRTLKTLPLKGVLHSPLPHFHDDSDVRVHVVFGKNQHWRAHGWEEVQRWRVHVQEQSAKVGAINGKILQEHYFKPFVNRGILFETTSQRRIVHGYMEQACFIA